MFSIIAANCQASGCNRDVTQIRNKQSWGSSMTLKENYNVWLLIKNLDDVMFHIFLAPLNKLGSQKRKKNIPRWRFQFFANCFTSEKGGWHCQVLMSVLFRRLKSCNENMWSSLPKLISICFNGFNHSLMIAAMTMIFSKLTTYWSHQAGHDVGSEKIHCGRLINCTQVNLTF